LAVAFVRVSPLKSSAKTLMGLEYRASLRPWYGARYHNKTGEAN